MKTFSENLIIMRKRAGFTQEDLASAINVSIDTIRRWEGDKQEPRLGDLKLISKILNVSIDELAADENNESDLQRTGETQNQKNILPKKIKNGNKDKIIIQQGNTKIEIPATSQGYSILREKLKEVTINSERFDLEEN